MDYIQIEWPATLLCVNTVVDPRGGLLLLINIMVLLYRIKRRKNLP